MVWSTLYFGRIHLLQFGWVCICVVRVQGPKHNAFSTAITTSRKFWGKGGGGGGKRGSLIYGDDQSTVSTCQTQGSFLGPNV